VRKGGHGRLLYEVGANDDDPDAAFVSERWESAEAHAASLELDRVRVAEMLTSDDLRGSARG